MSRNVDNSEDILDSRDVIARQEELQGERDNLEEAVKEAQEAHSEAANTLDEAKQALGDGGAVADLESLEAALDEAEAREIIAGEALDEAQRKLADWESEYAEELTNLDSFVAEGGSEWRHGETLVHEDYFENFARQEAEDLGLISSDTQWPATCIDWAQAARELQQDYTGADFDGVTYYFRS